MSSHRLMLSQTERHMSSTESALLLEITISDLKRFFTVSLPFAPVLLVFVRVRFSVLHSFGTCNDDGSSPGILV